MPTPSRGEGGAGIQTRDRVRYKSKRNRQDGGGIDTYAGSWRREGGREGGREGKTNR